LATLSLENLVKIYNGKQIVNSVNMKIENNSVVGLLGPNGAGKTTTFYMTIGMIKPDKGQVFLDEEDITTYPIAGIDPLAVIDIKNIISHLKNRGIGILISDHNVRETLEACDKAFILNDGEIIESGPLEKIVSSETARRIYLGDEFKL